MGTATSIYKHNLSLPRNVTANFSHPSAFVAVTRFWCGAFGYFYASHKLKYLEAYVHEQNTIKAQQLSEAEVDPTSLRGVTYFAPEFYDPEFSEYQGALRDRYPDYYLSPTEEFIYQTTRGKMKESEVKEQLHGEAVDFLRQWQAAES